MRQPAPAAESKAAAAAVVKSYSWMQPKLAQIAGPGSFDGANSIPIANAANTALVAVMMTLGRDFATRKNRLSVTVFNALSFGIRPCVKIIMRGADVKDLNYCGGTGWIQDMVNQSVRFAFLH